MMNIPSTLKISIRALRVNKMRSALTMLGVIIGVGAVITMLAVGTGASEKISQQISSIGSNLIIILPGSTTAGGLRMGMGSQPTLTRDDADAIKRECSAVEDAAPVLNGVAQVVYGNQNWSTGVYGTTPSMLNIRDWPLASGRAFTDQDVRSAMKVCLMGQTVVVNLFGNIDPLGQIIRRRVITLDDCSATCIIWVRFRTVKSSSCFGPMRCLCLSNSLICVSAVSISSALFPFTIMDRTIPGKMVPNILFCAVLTGMYMVSS